MQVVEVDLTDCISQDYILRENWEGYKKYKQHKYLRSYTRYVYIRHLAKGTERAFYMTIVPTIDCVRNFSTRINRNTYLQRNKYLSGYILYHSLEGDFINGWEYKDGQITGKVISPLLAKELDITDKKPLLLGKINSSYTVELKVDAQSRVASRSSEVDNGWDWDLGELPEVTVTPGSGSNNDNDWDIDDGSDWDDIWDDWQAPETGDDSDDDDAPVVVPDDDSGSSGGVSGGVDDTLPNISSCKTLEQVQQYIPERLKKVGVDLEDIQIMHTTDNCNANAIARDGKIYVCDDFFGFDIKDQTAIIYHEFYHLKNDIGTGTDWNSTAIMFEEKYCLETPSEDIMVGLRSLYEEEYACLIYTYSTIDDYIRDYALSLYSIVHPDYYQNEVKAFENEISTIKDVTVSYDSERKAMLWLNQQKYKKAVELFKK